jgi:hypothetical protein
MKPVTAFSSIHSNGDLSKTLDFKNAVILSLSKDQFSLPLVSTLQAIPAFLFQVIQ